MGTEFELVDITGYLVWATQNIPAHHNVPTNQNVPKSPLAPLDCPCAKMLINLWLVMNFSSSSKLFQSAQKQAIFRSILAF